MSELGDQLDTISGLRVKDYDADEIQVPAGLITLPMDIDYRGSFRGMRQLNLTVIVLVQSDTDRVRKDLITPYADDEGSKSVIATLERGNYTSFDSISVHRGRFRFYVFNQIKYLGIGFDSEITVTGKAT